MRQFFVAVHTFEVLLSLFQAPIAATKFVLIPAPRGHNGECTRVKHWRKTRVPREFVSSLRKTLDLFKIYLDRAYTMPAVL